MKPFFKVLTVEQVHALAGDLPPLPGEEVALDQAGGRTLAGDLVAPEDLPGFTRSTMDGYALKGRDTFGSSEASPAYLELKGEVPMGRPPDCSVGPGQCARIFTGGMLPPGADAVVMVEYTRLLDQTTVEVAQAVAPGSHLLGPTDDAAQGQVLLPEGHLLRAQDLGLLAGLGLTRVSVRRRPLVGILSTGDEVVPVEQRPGPGQVRDVNRHTLSALVQEAGGQPLALGLVGDQEADLRAAVEGARQQGCDMVLLSGGSSVGTRDLTAQIFTSFEGARLLVHGVAVSPGKPFIWVADGSRHLMGLPGQVASCMVAFYVLVEPVMERLLGRPARAFRRFPLLAAELTRNLPSAPGREDYWRVRLGSRNGDRLAEPLFGKSGLISTLVRGDGLVRIPLASEGLYEGQPVEVLVFP